MVAALSGGSVIAKYLEPHPHQRYQSCPSPVWSQGSSNHNLVKIPRDNAVGHPLLSRYLTPSPPVAISLTSSGTSRLTTICTSIPAAMAMRWTLWAVDPPRSISHHRLR